MKYFILIILSFLLLNCGDDAGQNNINNNPEVIEENLDLCENNLDCKDNDEMISCLIVNDLNNQTARKECTFNNCDGWSGYLNDGNTVYSYYKDVDENCNKKILIKAEDNQ